MVLASMFRNAAKPENAAVSHHPEAPTGRRAIVMLRGTAIAPDPRVERTARWAAEAGWRVTAVGWDREGSNPLEERREGYEVLRIRVRARFCVGIRNLIPLLVWQLKLLFWLWKRRSRFQIIKASDLDTALPAIFVAKLFRKRLLYDIHDFYAESRYVPRTLQGLVRRLETWVVRHADAVMLPSEIRTAQLRGTIPKRLAILYNTPQPIAEDLLDRIEPRCAFRIAYVGILSKMRGLLQLLEVLERRPEWELEIAGYGVDHPLIQQKLRQLPNITLHGRVPAEESLAIYSRAHVIICTYDPSVPNHRLTSPNKLAEALMLGKPLIVAEGTSIDQIVKKHGLGLVVPYGNVGQLEAAFATIASRSADVRREFAVRARSLYHEKYSWSAVREVFTELLRTISN